MKNIKNKLKLLDIKHKNHGVVTRETTLWFGKWKNHRVDYVLVQDPGWLQWAIDECIISVDNDLYTEIAQMIEKNNDYSNWRED